MKLLICRTDSLPMPERMPSTCGISETSRQDSDLLQETAAHAPGIPKLLITALDERGRI